MFVFTCARTHAQSVLLGDRRVEGRGTFSATTASNESLKEYDRCTIASDYSNYDHNNFGDSHNNMHVRRKKTSLNQFYHLQRYTGKYERTSGLVYMFVHGRIADAVSVM